LLGRSSTRRDPLTGEVRRDPPFQLDGIGKENMRLLVIGAQPLSLGAFVKGMAQTHGIYVTTGGISDEDVKCDLTDAATIVQSIRDVKPDCVVCTAGVNFPGTFMGTSIKNITEGLNVNALGPLRLLKAWLDFQLHANGVKPKDDFDLTPKHFVAVSSNSAQIPRSSSVSYCMSKAALSMGIRVAARETAQAEIPLNIYGYEPGWIKGTPMSVQIEKMLGPKTIPHRIPGGRKREIDPRSLAEIIIVNLEFYVSPFNGQMVRVDSGEL
jgi:NAD(P)-dependent dehydrogenase (short-subunit alcohol dehydrogenase family)